jgi:hypothetical protein
MGIGDIIAIVLFLFIVIFLPLVFTNKMCTEGVGLCYKRNVWKNTKVLTKSGDVIDFAENCSKGTGPQDYAVGVDDQNLVINYMCGSSGPSAAPSSAPSSGPAGTPSNGPVSGPV